MSTALQRHARDVIGELTPAHVRAIGTLDEYWVRGPKHVADELGYTLKVARDLLADLRQHGVCNFGPAVSEDDGLMRGRGYWLDTFGQAVRQQLTLDGTLPIIPLLSPEDTITMHDRPLIGLSGYARSGKTAAALHLETKHGYTRQHIAEPLRRMLASLMKDFGYCDEDIQRYLVGDLKEEQIAFIGATSRRCQITLGTEWGRECIRQDLWADLWLTQATRAKRVGAAVLNDSVRFPNEEAVIRNNGGFTILIKRPGTGPAAFRYKRLGPLLLRWFGSMVGVHDSERVDRLRPDYIVINEGTLVELNAVIDHIIELEAWRRRRKLNPRSGPITISTALRRD